jgi:DDE family transposase
MYVATVPNRSSPPAVLLRESYREGGRVKTRTLANLSAWPEAKVEALRALLADRSTAIVGSDSLSIARSLPHGHVMAVVETMRRLGLDRLLDPTNSRERRLCATMIAARILDPSSKLALSRCLAPETMRSTLAEVMGVASAADDDLYTAMDWLLPRQERIEKALAKRHLAERTLVLYDVTSTYFEGRKCRLARMGYSRDGKRDNAQIVVGLLTDASGCPVAVEVFEGNVGDPSTVPSQVQKLRERFGLKRVVMVGDRGMLTSARIDANLKTATGMDWITTLRSPAIQELVDAGTLQLSLFDDRDLAEISSPDYPNERLVVCRNPLLADERRRKRGELLAATERELEKIQRATERRKNRLKGKDAIGLRVGKILGRFKVGKHFRLEISESSFRFSRDVTQIEREAALDGIYVIRTSLPAAEMDTDETVRSYKRLAQVERAFRSIKTVDLHLRPIRHRLENRVRAHVLICMLAYYVEWHMRESLAPLLFVDDDKAAGDALRESVVAKAQRSPRARAKAATKRTDDDLPVQSFQDLLADLGTITKNRVQPKNDAIPAFDLVATPTTPQQRALQLLGVRL